MENKTLYLTVIQIIMTKSGGTKLLCPENFIHMKSNTGQLPQDNEKVQEIKYAP